jgi:hypothetical protein
VEGLSGGEAEGGGGARKTTGSGVAPGAWERIGRREKNRDGKGINLRERRSKNNRSGCKKLQKFV